MNLKVLHPEDKTLRKVSKRLSAGDLKRKQNQAVIEAMLDFVYGRNHKGLKKNKPNTVGLSANQVGILKQISIVDLAIDNKGINDLHVLINPKVVWNSKSKDVDREGCVNLPETWGYISRYKEVKIEALDRSGNKILLHLKGWSARLLQHEIDHLNGYLFIDHLIDPRKAHLVKNQELYRHKKLYKKWEQFVDVSNLVRRVKNS